MATFRTDKGRPDIAFSGQYTIRPWTIANIGRLNNGSNVTPVFNYTYTIVQIMKTFEFTVDGVRYSVNDDNKTVTVAGYPSGNEPTGHLIIPKSVTYDGISYPVTSIGDMAFRGCSGLTSVTIPNSVTSIGGSAFYGCSGLTSVTIPNSVTSIRGGAFGGGAAFGSCSGLTSIKVESGNSVYDSRENCNAIIETATNTLITGCKNTIIPNSITKIGYQAFEHCSGLTSVTIPNSVTSIGGSAFYGCNGLTSVTIPNSVTSIGGSAFYKCTGLTRVIIGNSVTYISNYAFEYCSGLTSVTIGNSVTYIGVGAFDDTAWYNNQPDGLVYAGLLAYKYKGTMPSGTSIVLKEGTKGIADRAFEDCFGLTSVSIPNSVTEIGRYAFGGCNGLTSVTIPNSVTEIGQGAFYDCSGLASVTIGNSVTSIGKCAFYGCSGLTSVTIPNSVTSIRQGAFGSCSGLTSIKVESGNSVYDSRENCNAIIETATNTLISGCKKTIIPNSVTSISWYAFYECSGLTSVTIPNSVTSIGDGAFEHCTGLTSVTIPNSVTSIGYWAFCDCSGLTSVIIPNSVTEIGDEAFRGCSGLTRIDAYPNPEKVSTGARAFDGVPKDGTLHVLPKYLSAYQTASQWKDFTNIKGNLTEIGASTSMER